MGVNSLPSAWRTDLRTGQIPSRDLRLYIDPRGIEYPDLGTGSAVYTLAREDNLIDRGNCESATGPAMFGENPSDDGQGTATLQDTTVKHGGSYSIKWNKDTAAGAGAPQYFFADNFNYDDMHGFVAGETYECSIWVYIDSTNGPDADEVRFYLQQSTDGVSATHNDYVAATTQDAWEELKLTVTLEDDCQGCRPQIFIATTAEQDEYINFDDLRITTHTVPGSHYLSSGYVETLCPMTETFTIQIKFKPTFAYDTGDNQYLYGWYVGTNQYLYIVYAEGSDDFRLWWKDGGNARALVSADYDDGTANRNINQWITLTAAINLSTGDTSGSSLWLDKTQDDTEWSDAIDAKSTEFNKPQVRAYNGTAGAYDIAHVRYWPNRILTNAEVQNDAKDVADEEIFFSLDGHGTGRTRCNVSAFFDYYDTYKGVTSKLSNSHGTNLLNFSLKNMQGEFSDDQYAAFTPASYQYNGTSAQAYLRRRFGVILESWYSGDFEPVFVGRITEAGLQRTSYNHRISRVAGAAEDGVGDIDRTFETGGRIFEDYDISDTTESNSLFHTIAHLADRKNIQLLANNSFENATIGNSWLVTAGGTLNRDAADGYFGSASAELIPGLDNEQMYQEVQFTGSRKLNVGDVYTFWCWLKSTAAATAVPNYISIRERDSVGMNDSTVQSYDLAGGEGYTLVSVTHTITDSDSDRVWVVVGADAGDTINIDGCMLVPAKTAINYFDENDNDGASGVESADDAVDITWPWFGVDAGAVDYQHGWRRVEAGSSIWENLKSLANASGPKYCGMSECNTLTLKAVLETGYSDDVPIDEWTTARQNINITLDDIQPNKLVGHGVKIVKASELRLIALASATGNFADSDGDNVLSEIILDGAYWPSTTTYPEYWLQYGRSGDRRIVARTLTFWPANINTALLLNDPNPPTREYFQRLWDDSYAPVAVSKRDKMIGIKDGDLLHKLSSTGDGAGALTETVFDVTSRAGAARIKLYNGTGDTQVLKECGLLGKPVYLYEGDEGYVNDGHIDWADIQQNGERLLEFGGADVVTSGQLDRLADYLWKDRGTRKHIYTLQFAGTCHDISPSDVYTLAIGNSGETEYITSRAEVITVKIEHKAGSLGRTLVVLRELEEAWKYDSNIYSRFVARGVLVQSPSAGSVVTVGSEYCTVPTDFRIPIGDTSAETIINNAIDYVSGTLGGGTVRLTKGTYKIDGPILLKDNVILEGEGDSTVIEKNCNDYGIEFDGTGGPISYATVRSLKVTRNSSDTNSKSLIYANNCVNPVIADVHVVNSYNHGIEIYNCDDARLRGIQINGFVGYGVHLEFAEIKLSDVTIDNDDDPASGGFYVEIASGDGLQIDKLVIRNIAVTSGNVFGVYFYLPIFVSGSDWRIEDLATSDGSGYAYGVYLGGDGNMLTNVIIDNIDNTDTAANSKGIEINGDDNTCGLYVTGCSGTGVVVSDPLDTGNVLTGRSTSNGTNVDFNGATVNTNAFDST